MVFSPLCMASRLQKCFVHHIKIAYQRQKIIKKSDGHHPRSCPTPPQTQLATSLQQQTLSLSHSLISIDRPSPYPLKQFVSPSFEALKSQILQQMKTRNKKQAIQGSNQPRFSYLISNSVSTSQIQLILQNSSEISLSNFHSVSLIQQIWIKSLLGLSKINRFSYLVSDPVSRFSNPFNLCLGL